jgi:dihydroorotate dehydrogenase (fumarate)
MDWMEKKNFNSINEFKGLLSQKNIADPESWERQQYIKALVGIE